MFDVWKLLLWFGAVPTTLMLLSEGTLELCLSKRWHHFRLVLLHTNIRHQWA